MWPAFLPDGRHFVYVAVNSDPGRTEVRAAALDSAGDTSLFASNSRVLYANPDHLFFVRDGTLMAQPFDPRRLSLAGAAFPVAEGVGFAPQIGAAAFGVSANGALVYRTNSTMTANELTWFDRSGKNLGVVRASANLVLPVLSPDQNRAVVEKRDGTSADVWVIDLARGTSSRFTFDPANDVFPIFSPDGKQIAFASNRGEGFGVYLKPATGVGAEQLIHKVQGSALGIADWSPDGKVLLYNVMTPDAGYDAWALPMTGDRKPYPVLNQKYNEYRTRLSPDGRWMLYTSNETGRNEIYVQASPPSGGKWQVSVDGAEYGYWRADGREIVFDSPARKMMAVDVKLGATFEVGIPHPLFDVPGVVVAQRVGMTADAQKFLVPMAPQTGERPALRVVLNWAADVSK
jgi:eukaryotic-like serine/threonine-protein kinase